MSFKNPFLNGIFAEIYIILIATVINLLKAPNTPDTPFDGITAISLFVLSAAVMGYLFIGQPLQLYFDGHKSEAISFFGKTVGTFTVITVIAVAALRLMR